jgi:Asp-tRNA(Asn)/Glu-tRNA(Gln) amidotransferase A subunit family amidase
MKLRTIAVPVLLAVLVGRSGSGGQRAEPFHLLETTIEGIHAAYKSGRLTSRQVVRQYLNRIEAYDQKGPAINAIITVNPRALEEAGRFDAALAASGLVGPLHGIPVIIKER